MKITKKIVYVIIIVLIIILGIFAIKNAKDTEQKMPVAKQYPVVVESIQPKQTEVTLTLPYLSEVENDKDVNVSSKIMARVKYIKPSGSRVKKGDVIVRLDNTDIQSNNKSIDAQIIGQQAILDNLIEKHKRTKELLEIKGASIEQYQTEESNISALKSKIESLKSGKKSAQNKFTYTTITSPVNGVISKTMVNVGDMCVPGHLVAKLNANNGYFLMLRLPKDIKVKGVVFENNFYEVISLNSTFNGLLEYKIYVETNEKLTSGDRFEVDVVIYKNQGILLPFDAILNRNNSSYVLVNNKNNVELTPINIIETGEQGVVVNDKNIEGKDLIIAKQDIMLKILGGSKIIIKKD